MTRQTWTAVVSAFCFVACALVATLTPVPFVVWAPGPVVDLLSDDEGSSLVNVTNVTTYPASGRLLLTTLAQTPPDGQVSLLEALHAYWAPDREVVPAAAVYPAGSTAEEIRDERIAQFEMAQRDATAAALRTAGLRVDPVPVVLSVNATGPAAGRLRVGDIVVAIRNGDAMPVTVQTAQDAAQAVASGRVGDEVVFSLQRDGVRQDVAVVTVGSKSRPDLPVAGVSFTQGYVYAPQVSFALAPDTAGSSAGLMLALAVYDRVTAVQLLDDRVVSGTGTIDANGTVGRVRGVRERVAGARQAGASVFIVPRANCVDLAGEQPGLRLVAVGTLAETVSALEALADPAREKSVKGCP
nr:PDZ domain-containing protein [Propionibacterium sp.]